MTTKHITAFQSHINNNYEVTAHWDSFDPNTCIKNLDTGEFVIPELKNGTYYVNLDKTWGGKDVVELNKLSTIFARMFLDTTFITRIEVAHANRDRMDLRLQNLRCRCQLAKSRVVGGELRYMLADNTPVNEGST